MRGFEEIADVKDVEENEGLSILEMVTKIYESMFPAESDEEEDIKEEMQEEEEESEDE